MDEDDDVIIDSGIMDEDDDDIIIDSGIMDEDDDEIIDSGIMDEDDDEIIDSGIMDEDDDEIIDSGIFEDHDDEMIDSGIFDADDFDDDDVAMIDSGIFPASDDVIITSSGTVDRDMYIDSGIIGEDELLIDSGIVSDNNEIIAIDSGIAGDYDDVEVIAIDSGIVDSDMYDDDDDEVIAIDSIIDSGIMIDEVSSEDSNIIDTISSFIGSDKMALDDGLLKDIYDVNRRIQEKLDGLYGEGDMVDSDEDTGDEDYNHPRNIIIKKRDLGESPTKLLKGLMAPQEGQDLMNPFARFLSKLGIPIDSSFVDTPSHVVVSSYPTEDGVVYKGLMAEDSELNDLLTTKEEIHEDNDDKLEQMIGEIKDQLSEASSALHDLTDSFAHRI